MRQLWEVADFVRKMRREMRFGEISRAPLQLLRVELRNDNLGMRLDHAPCGHLGFQLAARGARSQRIATDFVGCDRHPKSCV